MYKFSASWHQVHTHPSMGTGDDEIGRLLGVRGHLGAVHAAIAAAGADHVASVAVARELAGDGVELGQPAGVVLARKDAAAAVGVGAEVVALVGGECRVAKDGDGNDCGFPRLAESTFFFSSFFFHSFFFFARRKRKEKKRKKMAHCSGGTCRREAQTSRRRRRPADPS